MKYISVVITAYNRREYLIKAVNSVINQSLDSSYYEIIVIKNFEDNEIDNYLMNANIKNIVMDGTEGDYILKGIEEATGEIISFLDDDDLFYYGKLEYIQKIFIEHTDLIYFHNAYRETNDDGNFLEYNLNSTKASNFDDFMINSNDNKSIVYALKHLADFNLSCISISKSIKNANYLRYLKHFNDTSVFYLALANKGTIYISSKKLTLIRFHVSLTRLSIENDESLLESFKNSMPTSTLEMMNKYFKNYHFYPLVKCSFYSNVLMEQLVNNSYSNFWDNISNFIKCPFIINFKERFAFLVLYIISYITKNNKIFIKSYINKVKSFRNNIKVSNDDQL